MTEGSDTIVALSSGGLPSAIAVIRASGPFALELAERMSGSLPAPRTAAMRLFHPPEGGEPIDEGLLLTFPAPKSVTGENIVEFQIHGSKATVGAMLDAMTSLSAVRMAKPGEFTRRALANGKMDLTSAEGLGDLLAAESQQQRQAAFQLLRGGLRDEWEQLREKLLNLSARAEAAIDYVGDEDETGGQDTALLGEMAALRGEISNWLELPARRPIREGIRVVLAGHTNAGKSSLLNAISGSDRAIVSDIEGTTRDTIEVPIQIDGTAYVLVDTAGLRDSADEVEQIGIGRSRESISSADILIWLGDPAQAPAHDRCLIVSSKRDLRSTDVGGAINVSAKKSQSLAPLFSELKNLSETILPGSDGLSLTDWQRASLSEIGDLLAPPPGGDIVLVAENLRAARHLVDALLGKAGVDEVLDRIFERFCLGK